MAVFFVGKILKLCEISPPQGLLEDFQSLFQLPLFLHNRSLHQEEHRALADPETKAECLLEAAGGRPIPLLP